ncbi:MAG TPA: VanW family protein [Patescibacteria group bacterium]
MSRYKNLIVYSCLFLALPSIAAAAENPAASQVKDTPALALTVDQYTDNIPSSTAQSWISHKTFFEYSPNFMSEIENPSFCQTDKIFCTLTQDVFWGRHLKASSETIVDKQAVSSYVAALAQKTDRDAADAKFQVDNGMVTTFEPAQHGVTLDQEKSVAMIINALQNYSPSTPQTIKLPFDSKQPSLDYANVNDLGISSLIGEGTSNFAGSPANRIKNIKVAIRHFNGVLIKPGEEFSFVQTLGEVDADHGYFPELVIKGNATEPDYGGGICQVSTTAFRAAIYSGLKITARTNHAYPVSYYNPQGMDSTVYVPRPDLKFINNTAGYILIQVKIVGTQLIFDFYGTNDGRKVTIDGPTITEKQPDGALKATFTQHVFDKDGNQFINDIFNSSYNSPYKYPHPGGPVLNAKPSNWSDDEWKNYKQMIKDMAKAQQKS